jgi:hypothetical protein
MSAKRVDITAILRDPARRRTLMVNAVIATQAREGITTTREQAEAAYDKVQSERSTPRSAHGEMGQ